MDAVVEELGEPADVAEESVLGTVIDEVREKVQATAPVFYDLVKTAAWGKEQRGRNTLKDPTKSGTCHESRSQRLIRTNLQRVSFMICQAAFSRNHRTRANKMHRPISLYSKTCGTAVKAFDTMGTLGVALTQKWALTAVEKVAKNKMKDLVNRVKTASFRTAHNNINRTLRVSHQRAGHNSHFDSSGTAATVFIPPNEVDYELQETNEEYLRKTAEGAKTQITPLEIQELHNDASHGFSRRTPIRS